MSNNADAEFLRVYASRVRYQTTESFWETSGTVANTLEDIAGRIQQSIAEPTGYRLLADWEGADDIEAATQGKPAPEPTVGQRAGRVVPRSEAAVRVEQLEAQLAALTDNLDAWTTLATQAHERVNKEYGLRLNAEAQLDRSLQDVNNRDITLKTLRAQLEVKDEEIQRLKTEITKAIRDINAIEVSVKRISDKIAAK